MREENSLSYAERPDYLPYCIVIVRILGGIILVEGIEENLEKSVGSLHVFRLTIEEKHRPPTGKFTTLRIKDEKGENTYILKMRFTDTVGNVRQHLTKHR